MLTNLEATAAIHAIAHTGLSRRQQLVLVCRRLTERGNINTMRGLERWGIVTGVEAAAKETDRTAAYEALLMTQLTGLGKVIRLHLLREANNNPNHWMRQRPEWEYANLTKEGM